MSSEKINAMRSLYNSSNDSDAIIGGHYAPNCIFQDPFVKVTGMSHVKAQFRLMRASVHSCESKFISSTSASGEAPDTSIVTHILSGKPKVWPWDLNIEITTHLRVDPDTGLISEHIDHWSISSTISNLPLINSLYDIGRAIFGTFSSTATNVLVPEPKPHAT
ncbi:hypothetical protein JKP88DRAFT_261029 [Tribonema minus]|uniref:SnoaL-like domain-containing protein n=1 Tax=Tribonema minus TaxID=303371 RepID=A0A835YWN6_9STRA|nr:hypothetical protein JKP88DRAFT_261029 [Tribonema minus]